MVGGVAGQRGDIWTFKFVIMDIVTFETAKRLKDAGFPQPAPAFGQFWYDDRGVLFFVVESFDENPIPFNGIWVIEKAGEVIHVNRGVFSESLIYAPSATDIWICVSPEQKEFIHDNPAEAAALAWLGIKKT